MTLDYLRNGEFLHDRLGNLYCLDPDGSTRKIENIGYKCDERVIAFEKSEKSFWLCTNRKIVFFDGIKDEWMSKDLPMMPFQSRLSDFPVAFSNKGANKDLAIQWSLGNDLFIAEIKENSIYELLIKTNCLFFSIATWRDEILLFGMEPRRFIDGEFCDFGCPAVFKVEKGGAVTNLNINFTLSEAGDEKRHLESILESAVTSDKVYIFCSIVYKIDNHYLIDDVFFLERPQMEEISSVAIFEINDGKSYLKEILNGYSYLASKIEMDSEIIYYFSKSTLNCGNHSLELMALIFLKKEESFKKTDVIIKGLSLDYPDSKICFFKAWYSNEHLQFYGVLSVYTKGGEKGILILSKDGYQWEGSHDLYEATH